MTADRASAVDVLPDPPAQGVQTLGLRQSMASLHGWVGLLCGWLCFLIFLFGTTAIFQQEISAWMRPELRAAAASHQAMDAADAILRARAPRAARWDISLPAARSGDPLSISWKDPGDQGPGGSAVLDPQTGREIVVRDTRGGNFLYRLHFDLYFMPALWAETIVSAAALAMLVALLSGIITHKRIFADFFQLRLGKGQRSWLDAHHVTAVVALPFYLVMTYTGLVALLFVLMPGAISAHFPDRTAFYAALDPGAPDIAPSGRAASPLPLRRLAARGAAVSGGITSFHLRVSNPGDAASIVGVWPKRDGLGEARGPAWLDGTSGALLRPSPDHGWARTTQGVMIALHTGLFAGPALRWLYFLSGVGGTMMIATGLVLWTAKCRRRLGAPDRSHGGLRLVERLNIGVMVGAPAGIAVYFIINRALALDTPNRADWEINSLFIVWGGLFVGTVARPVKIAWTEALAACAMLYAAVPVVSALTTTRGLIASLTARDWVFVGFDLTMLATAAAFALTAWMVLDHRPGAKTLARREQSSVAG